MTSRDKIEYGDLGPLGKKIYRSDKFKIPGESTIWYSDKSTWSNMAPKVKDGDLLAEVEYVSALISDATARMGDSLFEHEFRKWKNIAEEITHSNKDYKRPINAIRRRMYMVRKSSDQMRIEVECSILRLLAYRNKLSDQEFLIDNYLIKTI